MSPQKEGGEFEPFSRPRRPRVGVRNYYSVSSGHTKRNINLCISYTPEIKSAYARAASTRWIINSLVYNSLDIISHLQTTQRGNLNTFTSKFLYLITGSGACTRTRSSTTTERWPRCPSIRWSGFQSWAMALRKTYWSCRTSPYWWVSAQRIPISLHPGGRHFLKQAVENGCLGNGATTTVINFYTTIELSVRKLRNAPPPPTITDAKCHRLVALRNSLCTFLKRSLKKPTFRGLINLIPTCTAHGTRV